MSRVDLLRRRLLGEEAVLARYHDGFGGSFPEFQRESYDRALKNIRALEAQIAQAQAWENFWSAVLRVFQKVV